ncbi:MAG: hypothetical protein ACE10K_13530 [Rhodothermales bacterium]
MEEAILQKAPESKIQDLPLEMQLHGLPFLWYDLVTGLQAGQNKGFSREVLFSASLQPSQADSKTALELLSSTSFPQTA